MRKVSEMSGELCLGKLTLIITTRCNLRCALCCEYVPQHTPFPDMTIDEEGQILAAAFDVIDHVDTLHLSGGGEPFLHKNLPLMIDKAFEYETQFDRFMVFTNSTIPISDDLMAVLIRHKEKTIVHASDYGVTPEQTTRIHHSLQENDINFRVAHYYGDKQDFGGWVDFGSFEKRSRSPEELSDVFANCAVTRDMRGNWRTRDGKLHWCSRSQRGLELGQLPNFEGDYVDLLDKNLTKDEKQAQMRQIINTKYLQACDWCSGEQGTHDKTKRHAAAIQM